MLRRFVCKDGRLALAAALSSSWLQSSSFGRPDARCEEHAPRPQTQDAKAKRLNNLQNQLQSLAQRRDLVPGKQDYVHHGPLRLFTGNAHKELAQAIADEIGIPLGNATVGRFQCGEVDVTINESVRDCDVFVVQPTCSGAGGPQEHTMELLVMLDAIRRGGSNRITAVIPMFGYARQNAKERSRSPITAKLVTDILRVAGCNRVLTMELHAPQIQGFGDYPIDNMFALHLLAAEIEKEMAARGFSKEDVVVVSPDVGGTKRAAALAKRLSAPLAIFSRQRRRPTGSSEVDLVGDVTGKMCIIIDGIADTATTIVGAADTLKEKGASAVMAVVVHGIFSDPACSKINQSAIEVVLVTDTVPMKDKLASCPKMRVVSVAPLLAQAIINIHTSESLSLLFDRG